MITLSQENHLVRVQYTYPVQRIRQPPKNKEINRVEAKTYGLVDEVLLTNPRKAKKD